MTPSEYLDAAKAKMGIESDYELAKRLEITNSRVAEMRSGKLPMNTFVAFKIAVTLELDPSTVVADLEAQRQKNPKKREFFLHFTRRAAAVAAIACMLGWSYFAGSERVAVALGGLSAATALAVFYRRRQFA